MISVFDLFSIGIGPSSSHTVGPMNAANQFCQQLRQQKILADTTALKVELFGSLAYTGIGHGTDSAITMGIEGQQADTIDPAIIPTRFSTIKAHKSCMLAGQHMIRFDPARDIIFNKETLLPHHSNGMRFSAYDQKKQLLSQQVYYSIGGGFIQEASQIGSIIAPDAAIPYPFKTATDLFDTCKKANISIDALLLANESTYQTQAEILEKLKRISTTMAHSIERGCQSSGILPGGLNIKRRAPNMLAKLQERGQPRSHKYADSMNWLNMFAIAVNEENAAGGRIVTAPTNGAAGIIPAVLQYYKTFYQNVTPEKINQFLLTAAAIAMLYKQNASISGAEVGCQGEVGVASSMAAGALTAVLNGSLDQIENAAEIAMEHHLGMTCDPVAGLVQIPCIERNAMGAVKAVNAMRLAMIGDGHHLVSLDKVIKTMLQTGRDMMSIYKETSEGGLAANVPEC